MGERLTHNFKMEVKYLDSVRLYKPLEAGVEGTSVRVLDGDAFVIFLAS